MPTEEPRPDRAGAPPPEGAVTRQPHEPASAAPAATPAHVPPPPAPPTEGGGSIWKPLVLGVLGILGVAFGLYFGIPWVWRALNTVSTDDAYVNSHVTFVAPRVSGQVTTVLVDDNVHVKKGALLVQLDKEPYQVQVAIKSAAVATAKADLVAAYAHVRGLIAQGRGNRHKLEHAIEDVNNQIAALRANVAALTTTKARLARAKADYERAKTLAKTPGAISDQDLDLRRQDFLVAEAQVQQALEGVYQIRVGLGLPAQPENGELGQVPPDLDQNFSTVRQALADLIQSAAQFGYVPETWDTTPKDAVVAFFKRYRNVSLDRIYAEVLPQAPAVKQAEAKLLQAQSDLDQALLNLRYCDVVSDIDGVVTSRNVNPGNNVQAGQGLMAVRSLTEIWIDANFKETQLAELRIGQRVVCEVDTYGSRQTFEGRITGFTMGTGQTLALLPPQNATGNFVKIVQRLPVRIELTDYDPYKVPLFVGLSVVPYVYYKEEPKGENAGNVLQPFAPLPQLPTNPKVETPR